MNTKLLAVCLILTCTGVLSAQAQERIRFQGRLTTPAGAAITTATDVVFRMYNAPTGGTALWTESHSGGSAVGPNSNGVFTVELGGITAITGVDFSQPVYVGITVSSDAEMTPRYLLTSSAHAHHAKNAATLGGLARTGFAELTGATFTGAVTATQFNGSGAGLTSIPAGQLTGVLPALNGSALTNVNAATLGGLARTGFAELTGATFTGAVTATQFNGSGAGLTSIPAGQLTGALPALNGSALTNLNAGNLSSGTLPDARLTGTYSSALTFSNITSATVATLNVNGTQTTTGVQQFADAAGDRFRVPRLASDPATGVADGMVYYNTTTNRMRVRRNGVWADLGPAAGTIVYSENSNDTALLSTGYTRVQSADVETLPQLSTTSAPSARHRFSAVWTGSRMLVWGGVDSGYLITGGSYDPTTDTWTTISTTGAPSARGYHTAVWTGSRMLVWGGWNGSSSLNTGGSYDPTTDTWTALSITGAPSGRLYHTAVWTGSRMLVWGGYSASYLNTGGSYDPTTDTWTVITTTGAPSARYGHTAVWAGSRMLVWGGWDGSSYLNTGGSYDATTNTWTAITTTGAPSGREGHTAVSIGSSMLVWGGYGGGNLDTGAIYSTVFGTWTAMSTAGAPGARSNHAAVWTGTHMLVWGGLGGVYLRTGGSYHLASDTWTATTITNAPSARSSIIGLWTGSQMLVWGGYDGNPINTGGRYEPFNDRWTGKTLYAYRAP
ncbi:MAG: hypothetical protein HS108_15115 [Planctomycetes bacterium]|nr:hypothetical protein [Planctomycetota bacterium]